VASVLRGIVAPVCRGRLGPEKINSSTTMWPRSSLVVLISSAALVFAAVCVAYRLVDPLPPRHLVIAAGAAGSGYDKLAKRYARILAAMVSTWRSATPPER